VSLAPPAETKVAGPETPTTDLASSAGCDGHRLQAQALAHPGKTVAIAGRE
jgi:hypothetical protein